MTRVLYPTLQQRSLVSLQDCGSEMSAAYALAIHTLDDCVKLIVSPEYPYRILATAVSTPRILGYLDLEIHGESFFIFSSDSMDVSLISSAILEASNFRTVSFHLRLRDKAGFEQLFHITATPFRGDNGTFMGCMLLLDSRFDVPIHPAYPQNCGDGRTRRQSPNLMLNKQHFCNAREENYFISVSESHSSHCQYEIQHNQRDLGPDPDADSDSFSTILPRRRNGANQQPVVVTPATVRRLQSLPIQKAADVIGISATALKRACRRLGVDRWPYHRGAPGARTPPAESPPSDLSPHTPADPACFFDHFAGPAGARDGCVATRGSTPQVDDGPDGPGGGFAGHGPAPSESPACAPPPALWVELPPGSEEYSGAGYGDGDGGGLACLGLPLLDPDDYAAAGAGGLPEPSFGACGGGEADGAPAGFDGAGGCFLGF